MKRLIFLLTLFIGTFCYGQRTVITGTIPIPTKTDTTIFVGNSFTGNNWSITFNYKTLNQHTGILDLGGADVSNRTMFDRLDDLRLPFVLADSTVSFEKSNFSFRYLGIKFTKGTCTTGTITYTIKRL
jgi:hypothetical protein